MRANGVEPDFAPRGDLSLKPWLANDQGLQLPYTLIIPVVRPTEPYASQIEGLARQIGKVIPRQPMKDKSGASALDPVTHVASVHGHSVLNLAMQPIEASFALPLVHDLALLEDQAMLDVLIAAEMNLVGDPALAAAEAARAAGNSANTVMAAAAAMVGPRRVERALDCTRALIDLFAHSGLQDARDESFDLNAIPVADSIVSLFSAHEDELDDPRPEAMLAAVLARGGRSVFLRFVARCAARPSRDALLAAIALTIAWAPLMQKRISRLTAETLPWYLRLYGVMIGASISADHHRHGALVGVPRAERFNRWTMADFLLLAITGRQADPSMAFPLQMLVGLLISNGPGAITAQGAKGAVAADGPQTPSRVQINKAMMGFLTHSGYSHGGNGFEGIAFLLDAFREVQLEDPGDPNHGVDLRGMALQFATAYRDARRSAKESGGPEPRALPGINHPVFRGEAVNYDPRERFVAEVTEKRGEYNIFHAYYIEVVQALYAVDATRTQFCVNVDAVIAALLLKLLWPNYRAGELSDQQLENAAFNVFLYGRMIGAAAEIDDHLNRGRNMDTRTPAEACAFVV